MAIRRVNAAGACQMEAWPCSEVRWWEKKIRQNTDMIMICFGVFFVYM